MVDTATESEEVPRRDRTGDLKREMLTEKAAKEFSSVLARIALQLLSMEARKKVDNFLPLISSGSFDAAKRFSHVKKIENSKRILDV